MRVYKRPDSKYWWIRDGDTRIPGNRKPTPFLRSQYTKTQVQSIIYENGMKTFLKAFEACSISPKSIDATPRQFQITKA